MDSDLRGVDNIVRIQFGRFAVRDEIRRSEGDASDPGDPPTEPKLHSDSFAAKLRQSRWLIVHSLKKVFRLYTLGHSK